MGQLQSYSRGRVVKAMDLKSTGFESCRLQFEELMSIFDSKEHVFLSLFGGLKHSFEVIVLQL